MKRFFIFFAVGLFISNAIIAQTIQHKADTISAALFHRIETHTLSKNDSAFLKQKLGEVLMVKNGDNVNFGLIIKLVNHKLSKADSAFLNWQIMKTLKIDTVMTKINGTGLAEKNTTADMYDLKLTSCNFEDNANAMILYDIGQMSSDAAGIVVERHKRIKIFNEKGKSAANIRLICTNQFGKEQITGISGQTINLNNGNVEYTKLDTSLIYHQNADKYHNEVLFSMPNVKEGSVIEIAYVWHRAAPVSLPVWNFQSDLPTRYSQFVIQLYNNVKFRSLYHITFHTFKDSAIFGGMGHVYAMSDVPSLKYEPFMRSPVDYLQSMQFVLTTAIGPEGRAIDLAGSWETIGQRITEDKQFNKTFDENIDDKEGLVKSAKKLPDLDAKVSFLFNQVKTKMKWNGEKNWASKDGIKAAWEKKSGNWGEINMVLCRLLNQSGVKAYPMLASTRENGKMFRNFADLYLLNKLVAYIPVDTSKCYVLDASGKYNNYNDIPFELLNSYGLCINKEPSIHQLLFLNNEVPAKQQVSINAEIKPDGTLTGNAELSSFSYNKTNILQLYNLFDEKKYMELLKDNDNNLQILSLKMENADIDSLPLVQTINFHLNLPGTDDKYIYLTPNLLTGLRTNPFTNERRFSDIDFGCNNLVSINGKYKIPVGYKIEALPKSQTMTMPDKSIIFKRVVLEDDNSIIIYYVINFKISFFPKDIYFQVYDFYKKMFEMLNEPIVLKKI